jgi:hypothetical protein
MTLVGKWLNENTPASAVIAADEIGIIGFYSERPILDLEGLITPEIVPYKYRAQGAGTAGVPLKGATFEFLMLARPDYLVHQAKREYSLASTAIGGSVFEPILSYVHAQNMLAYWAADSPKYVNLYRCHWDRLPGQTNGSTPELVIRQAVPSTGATAW